jgi:hypothetical protein
LHQAHAVADRYAGLVGEVTLERKKFGSGLGRGVAAKEQEGRNEKCGREVFHNQYLMM